MPITIVWQDITKMKVAQSSTPRKLDFNLEVSYECKRNRTDIET